MTLGGRAAGRDPQAAAQAEAAATQNTLNYALGNLGGRRKSWMSSGQATSPNQHLNPPAVKRRPGRPPRPQPWDQAQTNRSASPIVAAHGESHPSSNSISPQLANVVSVRTKSYPLPSPIAVLPSPSPSEEAVAENAPTPTDPNFGVAPQNHGVQEADTARNQYVSPRDISPDVRFMEEVRQAALSKRPAEAERTQADKRSRIEGSAQQAPLVPARWRIQMTADDRQPEPPRTSSAQGQYASPSMGTAQAFSPSIGPQVQNQPENQRRTSSGQAQSSSPSVGLQPGIQRRVSAQTPYLSASSGHEQAFCPSISPQPQNDAQHHRHALAQGSDNRVQGQPQAGTTPPQPQPPFGPPRSLSRGLSRQPYGVPQANTVPSPTVNTPIQLPPIANRDWYTQEDCFRALNHFLSTHVVSEQHPRDAKRLHVLRNAVEQQDWSYLTIHQYYCLLSFNPDALPASFRNQPNLPSALQLIRDVLDGNESLSPAVLEFFANFPMTLTVISSTWPPRYEQEAAIFFNFMQHSSNFGSLRASCEQRGYPPLMRELVCDLGISSTVFQLIVFTAVLRRLRSRWGVLNQQMLAQLEAQAIALFQGNQVDFLRREASRPHNQPQSFESERRERHVEMQQWGSQLKELCQRYQRPLPSSTGPTLPGQRGLVAWPSQVQQQTQQQTRQQPIQHPSQNPTAQPSAQAMPSNSAQAAIQHGRGRPRIHPRQQPVWSSPRPPQQHAAQPQPTHQQISRPQSTALRSSPLAMPLLPQPGVSQPQQRQPNPARFSLHQANLRSPVLRAQSAQSVLYQFVTGFLKPPLRLAEAGHKIEKWAFSLSRTDLQSIPKDVSDVVGAPPTRAVDENAHLLRIRCIKWISTELPNEHMWATADTSWIPYSYFTFNGTTLQQRKKLHHGKDLPIDITSLVKEGENILEIAVMRQRNDDAYLKYLVAIELVGIKNHQTILRNCQNINRIDAATTLRHITQKLSSAGDDDEIAIVESNVTINLFDPFSASKVCDIPVRGKACLHYDCFDLETFLQTRKRKGDASVADQWRCPICNGDVRPQHLIADGFLQEVRDKLAQQGLLRTRAIIVDQDGSWKIKPEVRDSNSVQDRGSPDEDPVPTNRRKSTSAQAEVIDLSD